MKTYIWKERKSASILSYILICWLILIIIVNPFIVCPILYYGFGVSHNTALGVGIGSFLLSLPLMLIVVVIQSKLSTCNQFTSTFLMGIREELKKAKTIEELKVIDKKLRDEAIGEDYMIRLSFPTSIKNILIEIKNKIEILEMQ